MKEFNDRVEHGGGDLEGKKTRLANDKEPREQRHDCRHKFGS